MTGFIDEYWENKARNSVMFFEREEKEKEPDEMTKKELIAEINRLKEIIKKLQREKAQVEGMYLASQTSQLITKEVKHAKPRIPIH